MPVNVRFAGAMDGYVQGFHDLFGIDQSGRDLVPKNDFHFFIDPPDGPLSRSGSSRGATPSIVACRAIHLPERVALSTA